MRVIKDSAEARLLTVASPQLPSNLQNNAPEAPGMGTGSVDVTSNNEIAALCLEIRVVQNLIERCLQLYMNKDEVAKTLLEQARIEPRLTSLVWNKLEEDNVEFFKTYYAKLILIKQIMVFNELIDHHHNLLNGTALIEAPLAPIQKSIHYMPVDNLQEGYTLPQQLPLPSTFHPQIDSMGTVSSHHLINANLASGNFHPTQMNYGRWTAMDKANNIVPALPFVKSEIASPASVASNDQYPFIPREIPESVDTSSFDFVELSHVRSTGLFQLGPGNAGFNNLTDVEEYSGSTVLLDVPETNNNVNGTLYWNVRDDKLLSFSLLDEGFQLISFPPPLEGRDGGCRLCGIFFAWKELLATVIYPTTITPYHPFDIWVMNDGGGEEIDGIGPNCLASNL